MENKILSERLYEALSPLYDRQLLLMKRYLWVLLVWVAAIIAAGIAYQNTGLDVCLRAVHTLGLAMGAFELYTFACAILLLLLGFASGKLDAKDLLAGLGGQPAL